jgi:hypothetical protein
VPAAERAVSGGSEGSDRGAARTDHSLEDRYMDVMREIQFGTHSDMSVTIEM